MVGRAGSLNQTTNLYINDGIGNFRRKHKLENVVSGFMDHSDVDKDGDQDILIGGTKCNSQPTVNLYLNDGNGELSLVLDTPFSDVRNGSISFEDVDGDIDEDVLISGAIDHDTASTQLFLNDGEGQFKLSTTSKFRAASRSDVAFGDFDNDGDKDVIISGRNPKANFPHTIIYINDGQGNFLEEESFKFVNEYGKIKISDVDKDGDLDIFILTDPSFGILSTLYMNDGNGSFSKNSFTNFRVPNDDAEFIDLDLDGDEDLVIVGEHQALTYANDGSGNFTEIPKEYFDAVNYAEIEVSDFDDDGDLDVLISGEDSADSLSTNLYIRKKDNSFIKTDQNFINKFRGKALFVELNNVPGKELLVAGGRGIGGAKTVLYINNNINTNTDYFIPNSKNDFQIFPNPTTSQFINLSIQNDFINRYYIDIVDMNGRLLSHYGPSADNLILKQIDIKGLSQGMYIILLSNDSKSFTRKLVVH